MPAMSANIEAILAQAVANPTKPYSLADFGFNPSQLTTMVYPTPDIQGATMTGAEVQNLARFFANDFYSRFAQRDTRFYETKWLATVLGAFYAKTQLQGPIGSIGAGGSIIPQVIRPVTVYASGGTAVENWLASVATAGWNAGFFKVNLNSSNASNVALSPQNRVAMLIFGIADEASSPKLFEFQVKDSAGVPLGVHSLPLIHTVDNLNLWDVNPAVLVGLNQQITIDVNFEATGASIPELIGVQYVTREYATAE